jgi:glycosyltransferase involved in cell wall biosynthesis
MAVRRFFIFVPTATISSPIKGAVALANALARDRQVSFVAVKPGSDAFDLLDKRVTRISLWTAGSWPSRVVAARRLLAEAGGKREVAAVSYCLSADAVNRCCRDLAVTCASVRGNLPAIYPEKYGRTGTWLGHQHLRMLRGLDHVVSMTRAMAEQVQAHIGRPSPVIGNFVDEGPLESWRRAAPADGPFRFVFTGSMLPNKRPHLLLDAVRTLQAQGVPAQLDAFGDGPLLSDLRNQARSMPIPDSVRFHGHVDDPCAAVSTADALVLPSFTEGTSRSALEALYLGVPCVVRDIDGNRELIESGRNGSVFASDDQLATAMLNTASWSRSRAGRRDNLLPDWFRQSRAAQMYLELLETDAQ